MSDYKPLYNQSYALLIGIDSYSDPRFPTLGNAASDARSLGDLLAAPPFNFTVNTLFNEQATRQGILSALFSLRSTGADDRVLVYFAGHGYTLVDKFNNETDFLAASDTIPEQDFTALELNEVTDLRLHAGAKHIAFVFDACFSGQALGLTRSASTVSEKFLVRRAYQVISAGAGDPVWSPDGNWIVLSSFRMENWDIFLSDLKGSVKQLTINPADDIDPTWSPDSTGIVFVSNRSGERQLWVMDLNGENLLQLTDGFRTAQGASWLN